MNAITAATVAAPFVPGETVVWMMGLAALSVMLLNPVKEFAQPLLTIAHEGGHMVASVVTGRGLRHFELSEDGGGVTHFGDGSRGVGLILIGMAGYVAPPLLGLAGATLVVADRSWTFLWIGVVLLFGAWMKFKGAIAGVMVLVFGIGIGWVAVQGSAAVQAALALGLVWLLLIGGVENVAVLTRLRRNPSTDAAKLAVITWIPNILWIAGFWFVALVCLWYGGRALLGL